MSGLVRGEEEEERREVPHQYLGLKMNQNGFTVPYSDGQTYEQVQ